MTDEDKKRGGDIKEDDGTGKEEKMEGEIKHVRLMKDDGKGRNRDDGRRGKRKKETKKEDGEGKEEVGRVITDVK